MGKPTDRDLVARARSGDEAAFEQLVRRYQPRIYKLAVHLLRDRSEAEDVTQETFVRAFQALDRFDGRSEPFTWMYRIAVNLSLNLLRTRKVVRKSAPLDDGRKDARLEALIAQARDGRADPRGDASRKELYFALCAGLDTLSETLRTTLVLVCIDGLSHEEAGQVLGAPEGTIAWRVHEARKKLRLFLEARGFDPEGDAK
jgi:RNA polymerase sigma-70 factor (ECF subfamily)